MPRSFGFWSSNPITPYDNRVPQVPLPHSLGTGPGTQTKAVTTFPAWGFCQKEMRLVWYDWLSQTDLISFLKGLEVPVLRNRPLGMLLEETREGEPGSVVETW